MVFRGSRNIQSIVDPFLFKRLEVKMREVKNDKAECMSNINRKKSTEEESDQESEMCLSERLKKKRKNRENDHERPARKKVKIEIQDDYIEKWCMFVHFSQHQCNDYSSNTPSVSSSITNKWNPYLASLHDVSVYLSVLRNIHDLTDEELTLHKNVIGRYLPSLNLENQNIQELGGIKLTVPWKMKIFIESTEIPGYDTWKLFVNYCFRLADWKDDPFLVEDSMIVKDFIALILHSRDDPIPDERILLASKNFYIDNIFNLCTNLEKYLKKAYSEMNLTETEPIKKLLEVGKYLDQRVPIRNGHDVQFVSSRQSEKMHLGGCDFAQYFNRHGDGFWELKLVSQILKDVRRKALETRLAAWHLGVTEDMINSVLQSKRSDPECILTLDQYIQKGFGNEAKFWKELSTVGVLDDVRKRKLLPKDAAFMFGVSRAKVICNVGTIKTEEEIKEEKWLAAIEKENEKIEKVSKKPTTLDVQISVLENNIDCLSQYELMRLQNLKERKVMLEELGIAEDKKELRKMSANKNIRRNKPADYGTREKSNRIRNKMEDAPSHISKVSISDTRRCSPWWVGRWCPMIKTRWNGEDIFGHLTDDEFNSASPVPQVVLNVEDIISSDNDYYKSTRFLNSISKEFEETLNEKHLSETIPREYLKIMDSKVSSSNIQSVDTRGDLVCYGDKSGGVGVFLDGRSTTLKIHNELVTRTLFLKGDQGNGILSASQDGTVRLTDLLKQEVSVKYSSIQSEEKQEVRWIEPFGDFNFLMNIGSTFVKRMDIRSKDVETLFQLPIWKSSLSETEVVESDELYLDSSFGTNIGIHPLNPNLISICLQSSIIIYDIRNTKAHADMIDFNKMQSADSGIMFTRGIAGASWSPGTGSKFLTCPVRSKVKKCMPRKGISTPLAACITRRDNFPYIFDSSNFQAPVQTWPTKAKGEKFDNASFSSNNGTSWCPWSEGVFFTTAVYDSFKQPRENVPSRFTVVAIDAASGEVVSELSEGLDNHNYVIECHKDRNWLVVGNARGPGELLVYRVS